jgi:hypothetical protein
MAQLVYRVCKIEDYTPDFTDIVNFIQLGNGGVLEWIGLGRRGIRVGTESGGVVPEPRSKDEVYNSGRV